MYSDNQENIIHWNKADQTWTAPGLIDMQINGINGIDFNNPALKKEDVLDAARYMLSRGVTTFFPTVITNSVENILSILRTLNEACRFSSMVNDCVGGIHLEGPFISPRDGARGAHNKAHILAPDLNLFKQFQQAAGGKIKLVTLAPEGEGAIDFIRACSAQAIMVSMGHSLADSRQIKEAVDAGLMLSTHLGNGVPLMLKRHPNMLWDQLAQDELYATIIADGLHIPDSFIKTVMKAKGAKTIVVSDATHLAGLPPGEYESTIGGAVILDEAKRIELKNSPGLLAGAAKDLLENIETFVTHELATLDEAWALASVNVSNMLAHQDSTFANKHKDSVCFRVYQNKIQIEATMKNGITVFQK